MIWADFTVKVRPVNGKYALIGKAKALQNHHRRSRRFVNRQFDLGQREWVIALPDKQRSSLACSFDSKAMTIYESNA
jgi:hypothetical protein